MSRLGCVMRYIPENGLRQARGVPGAGQAHRARVGRCEASCSTSGVVGPLGGSRRAGLGRFAGTGRSRRPGTPSSKTGCSSQRRHGVYEPMCGCPSGGAFAWPFGSGSGTFTRRGDVGTGLAGSAASSRWYGCGQLMKEGVLPTRASPTAPLHASMADDGAAAFASPALLQL